MSVAARTCVSVCEREVCTLNHFFLFVQHFIFWSDFSSSVESELKLVEICTAYTIHTNISYVSWHDLASLIVHLFLLSIFFFQFIFSIISSLNRSFRKFVFDFGSPRRVRVIKNKIINISPTCCYWLRENGFGSQSKFSSNLFVSLCLLFLNNSMLSVCVSASVYAFQVSSIYAEQETNALRLRKSDRVNVNNKQ